MEKSNLLVRQTSKVEKIPEDEDERLLQQKSDELQNEHPCPEHTDTTPMKEMSPVSNALVRAMSQTDATFEENEKTRTVNRDTKISMPCTSSTYEGSNVYISRSYDETYQEDGKNLKKQKGICSFLKSKCSKQTVVNVVFGLFIVSALFIGLKALLKDSNEGLKNRYLYCYHCQNIGTVRNMIHVKDMCCTENPITEFPPPKTGELIQIGDKPSVESNEYNGTRILEFQADFFMKWAHKNNKDIIPWRDISMEKSFAKFEDERTTIRLLKDGNYVITLSLTTDTYHGTSAKMLRANACIVFDLPDGRTQEECRLITHSENMVVPFQIFKVDNLKNGTSIHAYITSSDSLDRQSTHNKLYLVML